MNAATTHIFTQRPDAGNPVAGLLRARAAAPLVS
jgi:hypothetical protein